MSSATPIELTPVLDPAADALGALTAAGPDLPSETRGAVAECLAQIHDCMSRARAVWQDYADNPNESDVEFTAVMRIGNERARDLHRIHLELRELAKGLTDASGVRFRDTIGFSSQVDIVQAYDELAKDETGSDRAAKALTEMGDRIARIEAAQQTFQ